MRAFTVLFLLLFVSSAWAGEGRIYAQRVSASTGLAVGSPIIVYNTASTGVPQSEPNVSFYDDRFLVVWNEWNGSDLDVRGARVQMNGAVLDTTPLAIHVASRNQMLPDVAADSGGWMVTWGSFEGTKPNPSVMVERVDYDGTLNSDERISFGNDPWSTGWTTVGSYPRIAWDSVEGKHLILFSGANGGGMSNNVSWALVTTTPTATIQDQFLIQNGQSSTHYPVAMMPGGGWTTIMSGELGTPWGKLKPVEAAISIEMSGNDAILNPAGYVVNNDKPANWWGEAEALDNNNYAWEGQDVATDTLSGYTIGVWTRYGFAGPDGATIVNGDIYAARINKWNPVEAIGGTEISKNVSTAVSERYPSLAGDGAGNLLVAYEKETSGSTEIASRILTVDGSGITPEGEVILRTDATGGRRSQIDVAYGHDGASTETFLVVWTEGWQGTL